MSYPEPFTKTTDIVATETITEQIEPTPVGSYDLLLEQLTNGERVCAEFGALWDIYVNRRDGMTMRFGDATITDDVIATRYFDQRAIEETYWRTRTYSPFVKDGATETIYIRIVTDDGEHEIYVDEGKDIKVMRRRNDSDEWEIADSGDADDCLYDFFYRTTIAADVHQRRNSDEKTVADNHARALLHERYPILALRQAPEE